MKLALLQPNVTQDKADNLFRVSEMLYACADCGASMAVLPEMFCIVYIPRLFSGAAEVVPEGDACKTLSDIAKKTGMTIIGGTVPERVGDKLYNTCPVFGNDGALLGKYRKAHMFDVDFPEFRFIESETLTRGENTPLIIDAPVRTGVSVCFDIRFPEWSRMMMNSGVDLIALPAAFSKKTGPMHWELLLRARAVDNQCFVAGVSPAASPSAYGHTMLCAPDGSVITELGENEAVSVVELPTEMLDEARRSIPIKSARRTDLYSL